MRAIVSSLAFVCFASAAVAEPQCTKEPQSAWLPESAIKAKADALRENPGLVALTATEKWDGKLPSTFVPGSAVPFIQMPQQR